MESNSCLRTKWVPALIILIISALLPISCGSYDAQYNDHAPVISALTADKEVVFCSQDCEVTCVASDPDGDSLTYAWAANSGNISAKSPTAIWAAPDVAGTYAITVVVRDGNGNESASFLDIEVIERFAPIIEALTVAPRLSRNPDSEEIRVSKGEFCDIECVASGQEGDELSYEWSINGGSLSGMGSMVTWKAPSAEGTYNITVLVTDEQTGETTKDAIAIDVRANHRPTIDDEEPFIFAESPKTFNPKHMKIVVGTDLEIRCKASDPDDDELSYEWSVEPGYKDLGEAGKISADGNIATYTAPDSVSKVRVIVTVSDGRGGTCTDTLEFLVVPDSKCLLNK